MLYHESYTSLQVKCVQYWPDAVGQSQTFGSLNVHLSEELEFADYVVRTIELKVLYIFITGVVTIDVYRILSWVIVYMW